MVYNSTRLACSTNNMHCPLQQIISTDSLTSTLGVDYGSKMKTNVFNFTLFFSCAFSFFNMISWYSNLQVPTNLGGTIGYKYNASPETEVAF